MSPGLPKNPDLVIIDTSVLIQLVCTDNLPFLRSLRSTYKIQPAIVQAVESETLQLMTTHRFVGRQEQLKKAISNGTIGIVDRSLLTALFESRAEALQRQIDAEGERYYLRVDRGEAYSHAAASVLGVPIATNDTTAVNRLLRDGEIIPRPILRFWDLIVLAHQVGDLDDAACDKTRQALAKLRERLPACLDGKSFTNGLKDFYPRLVDGGKGFIGAADPQDRFDERLTLWPSS